MLMPEKKLWRNQCCSHLFFQVHRVLVSWCSKTYLITFSSWLLASDPVQQTSLLASIHAQKHPGGLGERHAELTLSFIALWSWAPPGNNPWGEPARPGACTQPGALVPADPAPAQGWRLLLQCGDVGFPCLCPTGSMCAQELQSWVGPALQPKEQVTLVPVCGRGDPAVRLRGRRGRTGIPTAVGKGPVHSPEWRISGPEGQEGAGLLPRAAAFVWKQKTKILISASWIFIHFLLLRVSALYQM